ncbi:MAG TPA: RNA methyltransferase [Acidimicrobiales bacterium]|nr:RNA methyltransferase [Acidimicrobiales bacterium]
MADPVLISDPGDPRVAEYVGLTDAARRRLGAGTFMLESELVVRRAMAAGVALRSVLVTPPRLATLADDLIDLDPDVPVYLADQAVMSAVAGFDVHRGVLASADRPAASTVTDVVAGHDRIAVVEGLTDTENLGAVFRNAAALGVGAVVLDPACTDPLYRRTVRVSMGYVLATPWARADAWPDALHDIRSAGFRLLALTPQGAEPLDDVAARPGERLAIMLGAEGPGLSEAALAAADQRVAIPMAEGVDSLNAATAAAIAFHHLRPPRG